MHCPAVQYQNNCGQEAWEVFLFDQTLEIIRSACFDVNICARLRNTSLKLLSGHQMVKMDLSTSDLIKISFSQVKAFTAFFQCFTKSTL